MGIVAKYASLVKFSHTVFALPFALVGYVYALRTTGTAFEWWLLLEVLLCMVFARNAAMGFNRWADRKIDAENPRTAGLLTRFCSRGLPGSAPVARIPEHYAPTRELKLTAAVTVADFHGIPF